MRREAVATAGYMSGFGGHFATEAVRGALPEGRNSPQRPAHGLYAEQLSGTAFTAPRHENRRSWLYRMRPSAEHPPYRRYEGAKFFSPGTSDAPLAPRSEEHTSELQSLMRTSYAVFCLKKKR